MLKTDLVQCIVNAGLARKDAEIAMDVFIRSVIEAFQRKERVDIKMFGSFIPKHRKPRVVHNIVTNEMVQVPEKTVLTFKPSTAVYKPKK